MRGITFCSPINYLSNGMCMFVIGQAVPEIFNLEKSVFFTFLEKIDTFISYMAVAMDLKFWFSQFFTKISHRGNFQQNWRLSLQKIGRFHMEMPI